MFRDKIRNERFNISERSTYIILSQLVAVVSFYIWEYEEDKKI